MEDGTKEDPVQQKEPKFLCKAGWVKKAHGRLLTSYKERYVHVEKTEMVVYENEDLKNCLERLDLENYDTCHELKSPFKKKHRLILIRSPKSGHKVHDLKFQTQTTEEKEAWIKALSDGINRAKNKVFDEVKVDESSNLEHVTRTRPKGNRNRRPPTRIHMKEVADVSSDGILRLDLNLEDAVMPNGTQLTKTDNTEPSKEALHPNPQLATQEEADTEPEDASQKKAIKPPMPPTKEAKPSPASEDKPDKDEGPEKKKPPMPPSKEAKPCATPAEEASEYPKTGAKKKTGPPPTPPCKPSSSSPLSSTTTVHLPTPPSKGTQLFKAAEEPREEEAEEDSEGETAMKTKEVPKVLPHLSDDDPESSVSDEITQEMVSNMKASDPAEAKESQSPLLSAHHPGDPSVITQPNNTLDTDTSTSPPPAPEVPIQSKVPLVAISDADLITNSLGLSPLLSHLPGEKKKAEEKSVDSGQHSDDESEGSGSEDTLAASTAALRGSHVALDVLDAAEDNIETSVHLRPTAELQVRSIALPYRRSEPSQKPPKPSCKPRSVSIGDLLSESSGSPQQEQNSRAATDPIVTKLETEVALEIKRTSELLRKAQGGGHGESMPEDLLGKALEKLKKADHVLKEVQKLKCTNSSSTRMSW
uniref:Pleckstrin homology domain containing, family O member 2 n=1 Tax=Iconisemion striatum TaxID=60296 RepID=A0A1A7XLG8_9TELE